MAAVNGYNMYITIGGYKLVGVTQDDLSISVNSKESIRKSDAGVRRKVATSTTTTFKVSGVMGIEGSNTKDSDDLLAAILSKSRVHVVYTRDSGATYGGDAIITGYTESTPADPDSEATYTLDMEIIGSLS